MSKVSPANTREFIRAQIPVPGSDELGQQQLQLFGLLDPLSDPADEQLPEEDFVLIPVPIAHSNFPESMRPVLVAPRANSTLAKARFIDDFLDAAAKEAAGCAGVGRRFAALMCSTLPAKQLALALGRSAVAIDAKAQRRILRYWDPRVAQHLTQPSLRFESVVQGIVTKWWFVDARGQLMAYVPESLAEKNAPLHLTAEAEAVLGGFSELNACFELARPNSGAFDAADPWRPLRACLSAAQEAGLRDEAKLHFAAKRWQLAAPIESSLRIQALLRRVQETGIAYTSVQAELDDEDWALIASEAQRNAATAPHHTGSK